MLVKIIFTVIIGNEDARLAVGTQCKIDNND